MMLGLNNMKWKTKTGEMVDIKDMSENHLINTIKMLAEKKKLYDVRYALERELEYRRGEICEHWRNGVPEIICTHEVGKFNLD